MRRFVLGLIFWTSLSGFGNDVSQAPTFRIEAEGGLVWQTRNDVRIPGDSGTLFSLRDFRSVADVTGRVSAFWNFAEAHSLKLMIFPFATEGETTPLQPISFQGTTFAAGQPTQGFYRFHSYRLSYRYLLTNSSPWEVRVGFTAKIRNARIAVKQGAVEAEKTDLGFVPLLNFTVKYHLTDTWRLELDGDALAAPQGRAEDVSLFVWHRPGAHGRWELGGGYRTLEGGADNSSVFTFAWLHFASLTAAYLF